jgi:iron(III) transport system ATP-binding protein
MAEPAVPQTDLFLKVADITKTFGRFTALRDVSFQARRGEFLCVLGPSGCGKTTLLRVIAGLEKPDRGRVCFQGRDVSSFPVSRRNVGIVFQSYALFPNLTAGQNIAYGLKSRRGDTQAIRRRIEELLRLVGLEGLEVKYPRQLSGGQQQRVALARAMVDRILVMDRGEIVQDGMPMEIYRKPATPFVAAFIGSMNFLPHAVKESPGQFRIGSLNLAVENGSRQIPPGTTVTMAIRPEDIVVRRPDETAGNSIPMRVRGLEFRGSLYRLTVHFPEGDGASLTLQADVSSETVQRLAIREDMDLAIHLPADRIRVYAN